MGTGQNFNTLEAFFRGKNPSSPPWKTLLCSPAGSGAFLASAYTPLPFRSELASEFPIVSVTALRWTSVCLPGQVAQFSRFPKPVSDSKRSILNFYYIIPTYYTSITYLFFVNNHFKRGLTSWIFIPLEITQKSFIRNNFIYLFLFFTVAKWCLSWVIYFLKSDIDFLLIEFDIFTP